MPNWCDNSLHISHEDPEMMKKAAKAWNDGHFLATLVPEPDYKTVEVKPTFPHIRGNNDPVDPETAWWDWRVQNWGTKWDIGYDSARDNYAQVDGNEMFVYFDSAWSPPIDAYQKLQEMGFKIRAYYFESGCGFCGQWIDGWDDYHDIEEFTSKWVEENIPKDINDQMDISVQMSMDEEDQYE